MFTWSRVADGGNAMHSSHRPSGSTDLHQGRPNGCPYTVVPEEGTDLNDAAHGVILFWISTSHRDDDVEGLLSFLPFFHLYTPTPQQKNEHTSTTERHHHAYRPDSCQDGSSRSSLVPHRTLSPCPRGLTSSLGAPVIAGAPIIAPPKSHRYPVTLPTTFHYCPVLEASSPGTHHRFDPSYSSGAANFVQPKNLVTGTRA